MSDLSYRFNRSVLFLTLFTLLRCGGAIVEDGTGGGTGGGGSGGTSATSGGATSHPYTGVSVCYGVVPSTSGLSCVGLTNSWGPAKQDATECTISVPVPPGKRLNPDFIKLYFDVDSSGKLEIPYVGALTSCPTSGTNGGWYTTNTAEGSTIIGLCGCTCLAAKKYPVTLNVDCAGLGM